MAVHAFKFSGKPEPNYVIVTPETADRWLKQNNKGNRGVRLQKVNMYAADMRTGNWQLSNDAICFDVDGNLQNGQHRLLAVVKSHTTQTFLVIRNMPIQAMTSMDTGAARTASDILRFRGETDTALLAAVTRQAVLYDDGRMYKDNKLQGVSHSQIIDFLEENPGVRRSVAEASHLARRIDAPPTATVLAHWIIARLNAPTLATHYLSQIIERTNEPTGSAVLAVDSRLRNIRRDSQKWATRNFVYLFIKGWNYYAVDKSTGSLVMAPPRGTEFKIPLPVRWSR